MTSLRRTGLYSAAGTATATRARADLIASLGVIRTEQDAAANTHPMPILWNGGNFQLVCTACGHAGPPHRATVAAALTDRLLHARACA